MARKSAESAQSVIINSVDRSIDILEYLLKANKETSLSQISKDLDVYKSTVFRTLTTLENRGYVVQNKVTELYSIGPKLYSYGLRIQNDVIIASVLPFLEKVSKRYDETVSFSVLERGPDSQVSYAIRLLTSIPSSHSLSVSTDLRLQYETYCAATGKCLLAFGQNVDLTLFKDFEFVKFTDNTITTYPELLKEIDKVRVQGYAMDDEERERGLFCLGVPVFGHNYAVAALSMSGPVSRMKDDKLDEKRAFLKEISKEISKAVFV